MAEKVDVKTKTFVAGEAITQHAIVKLSAGEIFESDATNIPIGSANIAAFNSGELIPVDLLSGGGTIKCIAADAITQGAVVYNQANGEVDDSSANSALKVGIALDTATAANDIIEVLPHVAHV